MKAERLIFHIGLPKTGTTTLQSAFFAARLALRDAGVLYPDGVYFRSHKALLPHFAGNGCEAGFRTINKLGRTDSDRLATSERLWRGIKAEVAQTQPQTIVLSAEQFQRHWSANSARRLLDLLFELADQITVVAYLRDPASGFLSGFQQHVKFRPGVKLPPPKRYRRVLEPLLGRPGVTVEPHVFLRERLVGQDIIEDFRSRYMPNVPASVLADVETKSNESLSPEAMALMQEISSGERRFPQRFIHAKSNRPLRVMRRAETATPAFRRPVLRPGIPSALFERATDLEWLETQFGLQFPKPQETAVLDRQIEQLQRVEDFCEVDPERMDRLWQKAKEIARKESSFSAHLRRQIKILFQADKPTA